MGPTEQRPSISAALPLAAVRPPSRVGRGAASPNPGTASVPPRQPLGLQWPRTHTPFALRVFRCPLSSQHEASKVIDAALFTDAHQREQTRETRIANTVVSRKVGAHRSHTTAFPTRSLCSRNRNVSAGIKHLTVVENNHVPCKSRKRDHWPGQVCRPFPGRVPGLEGGGELAGHAAHARCPLHFVLRGSKRPELAPVETKAERASESATSWPSWRKKQTPSSCSSTASC